VTATDDLGYLPGQGPTQPLTAHDVADLVTRVHDTAIPPGAVVPPPFNGLNVVTFEATHYGLAIQIATALKLYKLRQTDLRIIRWELPTEAGTKPAVLRVEYVHTGPFPGFTPWGTTEERAA
jgi:hypothetical protein